MSITTTTNSWTPTLDSDWIRQYVNLDALSGKKQVRLAFVANNQNGNNNNQLDNQNGNNDTIISDDSYNSREDEDDGEEGTGQGEGATTASERAHFAEKALQPTLLARTRHFAFARVADPRIGNAG